MKMIYAVATAAVALAAGTPAMAAQRFQFQYGCTSTGGIEGPALRGASVAAVASCANVSGSFDLDHSGNVLKAGDYFTTFSKGVSNGPISNLSVVVTGASLGNGSFSGADFSAVTFNTAGNLDLTRELVGQGDFGMDKFGSNDFNIFASTGSKAPTGAFFNYNANTNGGIGDAVKLNSLRLAPAAAVPEPGTWMTMILGFGLMGAVMRRRRNSGVAAAA